MNKAFEKNLPYSVEKSLNDIKNHYDRYLEVMDLDVATNKQMSTIYKVNAGRFEHFKAEDFSSPSESDADSERPGMLIQSKKKSLAN